MGGFRGGGGGFFSIPPQSLNNLSKPVDQAKAALPESPSLDQKLEKILTIMKAQVERDRPAPSSDHTLINLVQTMIQPDSWQTTGQGLGQVDVVNGFLVVSQTEAILQEIENFVADLDGNILQKNRLAIKVRASAPQAGKHATAKRSNDDRFGDQDITSNQDPFGN